MNPAPPQISRQIPLTLEHRPALGKSDFLVSASNSDAVRLLSGWRDWPRRHMALTGPARAGKTHLAHVWMRESGAELMPAAHLDDAAAERLAGHGHVVIEDVEALATLDSTRRRAAEKALFHLYNLAIAEGAWLLVTGRQAPGRWPVLIWPTSASPQTASFRTGRTRPWPDQKRRQRPGARRSPCGTASSRSRYRDSRTTGSSRRLESRQFGGSTCAETRRHRPPRPRPR